MKLIKNAGFDISITPQNPVIAASTSRVPIFSPKNVQAKNTVRIGAIIWRVTASPRGMVVHEKNQQVMPIPPTMARP